MAIKLAHENKKFFKTKKITQTYRTLKLKCSQTLIWIHKYLIKNRPYKEYMVLKLFWNRWNKLIEEIHKKVI